jgi:hypothetical protein
MSLSTTIRRTASIAAIAAVAGTGALAGTASAATVGQPEVLGPGTTLPIDFAAFKEPADNKLPKNHRIVREHIELTRGEKPSTVMTAPKGFEIVTIGFGDGGQVGGVVSDTGYGGKRSVRVKLFANANKVARGQIGKGTLYLLARRA